MILLHKTLHVRLNFSGNPHFIITVSVWYLPCGSGAPSRTGTAETCTVSTVATVHTPPPQLCSAAATLTANVVKLLHLQFRHCFNKHNSTSLHNDLIIINR